MKNTKNIIMICLIIVILVIVGILAFMGIYFFTDILKSEKQLFFKYAVQLSEKEENQTKLVEYFEKKKEQTYENSGNLSVNVSLPEKYKDKEEQVNEINLSFEGKKDNKNKREQQDIRLNYSEDVNFPIIYKHDDSIYGLQTDYVGSKYIAIENDNLKEFFQKFEGVNTDNIPDKLEMPEKKYIKFTDEEKQILEKKYKQILNEQLTNEQFSKEKIGTNMVYTLEMTPEQIKNTLKQILESIKTDEIIMSKLNEYIEEMDSTIEEKDIDDLIENIENDIGIEKNIKIKIYESNKKTNKISLETEEVEVLSLEKIEENDDIQYNAKYKAINDEGQQEIYLNIKYLGLNDLSNVQESYTFGINQTTNEQVVAYEYNYENSVTFNTDISIDELNEDNALILNNQDAESIMALFEAIGNRINEINEMQMQQLEIEENPLIYANPITMAIKLMADGIQESMQQSQENMQQAQEGEESLLQDYESDFNSFMDSYDE